MEYRLLYFMAGLFFELEYIEQKSFIVEMQRSNAGNQNVKYTQ